MALAAGMPHIILATEFKTMWNTSRPQFRIRRPNICASPHMPSLSDYRRVRLPHDSNQTACLKSPA